MLIKQIPASVTTTWNMTWLPEWIYFVGAVVPSMLKVSVFGEGVITDLDAFGIASLSNIRHIGHVENSTMIQLADGIIHGKTVEISITNADTNPIDVYGLATESGSIYVQSLKQQALEGSGVEIRDFAYISFPHAGAGDVFNVTFEDETTHKFDREEIQALLEFTQSGVDGLYAIDNLDGSIRLVQFTPVATQTINIVQFSPAGVVTPVSGKMV